MENSVLLLWDSWSILGRVVAFLAIVVFALGIENIGVKLAADIAQWRRRHSEPTVDMLRRKSEDCTAILIPMTAPAPLAGAMLARLKRTLEYDDYIVFVGVRSIDAQTVAAVRRESRKDSRIQPCLLDRREAASPGRALNSLLDCARRFEHRFDVDFQAFVIQGPDTILHPLSLKLANWRCELASIVQLPVLTAPRGSIAVLGGAAMDELGENHTRELTLRARMVHDVPVLEVGVALRRDAIWALRHRGDVFDPVHESPVFDAVRRLNERGHLSTYAWQRDERGKVIAAEELAPRSYSDAVRAKARRLSARAFGDWRPIGSAQGNWWAHFFNYRDRRIVLVAATLACAAFTGLAAATLLLVGRTIPGFESMPSLVEAPWVLGLLAANAALAGAALIDRTVQTARTRGIGVASQLPIGLAAGVCVMAHAVLRASRKVPASLAEREPTGSPRASLPQPIGAGAFGKARITDILVRGGTISEEDATAAKSYSRKTGRQLALALQDLRLAEGAEIAKGLGEKLGLDFGHIDGPLDSHASVFLSRHEAERFSAFAARADDGGVDVYLGEDLPLREWRALRNALRRADVLRPQFRVAPLSEVAYAIRFAGTAQEMAIEQAIAVSLMDGPILEGTDRDIRRQLRAPYRRLEDLLVERGLIRPRRMQLLRRRVREDGPGIEDTLCKDRRIPPFTLAETVREFNAWRPAIAPLTSAAPLARYNARATGPFDPRLAA